MSKHLLLLKDPELIGSIQTLLISNWLNIQTLAELVLQVGYITGVRKFMVAYDSAMSK